MCEYYISCLCVYIILCMYMYMHKVYANLNVLDATPACTCICLRDTFYFSSEKRWKLWGKRESSIKFSGKLCSIGIYNVYMCIGQVLQQSPEMMVKILDTVHVYMQTNVQTHLKSWALCLLENHSTRSWGVHSSFRSYIPGHWRLLITLTAEGHHPNCYEEYISASSSSLPPPPSLLLVKVDHHKPGLSAHW